MMRLDFEHASLAILSAVGSAAIRTVALAAIAAVFLRFVPRAAPAFRAWVWTLVLTCGVGMPALVAAVPVWQMRVPAVFSRPFSEAHEAAPPRFETSERGNRQAPSPAPSASQPSRAGVGARAVAEPVRSIDRQTGAAAWFWPFLAAMYGCGCLILAIHAVIGWRMTRHLTRSAVPILESSVRRQLETHAARARLRTRPHLVESSSLAVPITMGVIHPAIVLPGSWRTWPPSTMDAVLAHEVAHVARRDVLIRWLSLWYRAVYWFNPLGWWLHRHLANLAEEASDEAALAAGADQADYAQTLLGFFTAVRAGSGRARWQAIAIARGDGAVRRVERILEWKEPPRERSRNLWAVVTVALVLSAALAAAAARPAIVPKPSAFNRSILLLLPTSSVAAAPTVPPVPTPVPHPSGSQSAPNPPCQGMLDCQALDPAELGWLRSYIGQSSYFATQDAHYRRLLQQITPDVMFHYRYDMPLGDAVTTILSGAARTVEGHDDRYVLLSACAQASCLHAQAFIWADVRSGVVFGGIAFDPTNGEPSPTLTLFSSRVSGRITKAAQLPAALWQDLDEWATGTHLSPIVARYFINGLGAKSVVPHEGSTCGTAVVRSVPCVSVDLAVAQQDLAASVHLLTGHFVPGDPAGAALEASQTRWVQSRDTACPKSESDDAVVCQITFTRARVQALNSPNFRPSDK